MSASFVYIKSRTCYFSQSWNVKEPSQEEYLWNTIVSFWAAGSFINVIIKWIQFFLCLRQLQKLLTNKNRKYISTHSYSMRFCWKYGLINSRKVFLGRQRKDLSCLIFTSIRSDQKWNIAAMLEQANRYLPDLTDAHYITCTSSMFLSV